jgi:hypothetical protein
MTALSAQKQKLFDEWLTGAFPIAGRERTAIPTRESGSFAPLSLAQEQIWIRSTRESENSASYIETISIHGNRPVDVATMERAFTEIVRRHEAWRTSFELINGRPVQFVHAAPSAIVIPVVDLTGNLPAARNAPPRDLLTAEVQKPMDLKVGPLVRPTLLYTDERNFILLVAVHQIVVDGISAYRVFPGELAALYHAFLVGAPSPLSELPMQFSDFSAWQLEWLRGPARERQIEYWKQKFKSVRLGESWPDRGKCSDGQTFEREVFPFVVPRQIFDGVQHVSRTEGATVFMVLLAVFALLVRGISGVDEVLIGTLSSAGRKIPECEGLLGYFLNPVALNFELPEAIPFREVLAQARDLVFGAISNDDIPFEELEKELGWHGSKGTCLRTAISLQPESVALPKGWRVTTMDASLSWSRWDFYVAFVHSESGLEGRAEFDPRIMDKPEALATVNRFLELAGKLTCNGQRSAGRVPR